MSWIANIVSLSRIPLAIITLFFLDQKYIVAGLIIIAVFTDWLDGRLAGKGTKLGAILDPLTDKFFALVVGIPLLVNSAWYEILFFFSRDIFTVIGACIFYRHIKGIKALYFGKMVTVLQFTTLLAILFVPKIAGYLIIIILITTVFAIIEYIKKHHETAHI